ncbi:PREDICTED: dispanin subfamily A member 2b-like [Nanorana parkeri]|uniref:dispanin subfamily A member 2b-like n=1 Tax=Nanorana parkeri TaxID=125878 RepID=UPI0008550237|nr:PREDICTED: dispanin subfamily A member 2b-like [Nanorana parkeri]
MAVTRGKDYLVWSIFSLICCFCPLGLAALIFSIKSRDANNQNDADTAEKHSRTSLYLNIAALVLGIILIIVIVAIQISARAHT